MTDKRPISDPNDTRLHENMEILQWKKTWGKSTKSPKDLMAAECHEDTKWMLLGFDSFVKMIRSQYNTPVYPCDIKSDIIEYFSVHNV